jgi:hypothetical protein
MIPAGATREGSLPGADLDLTGRIWSSLLTLFPGKATAMSDFPRPDGKRCAVALTFDMDGETAPFFLGPPNARRGPVVDLGRDQRRARRHTAYPGCAQQPPNEEHFFLPGSRFCARRSAPSRCWAAWAGRTQSWPNSPRRWSMTSWSSTSGRLTTATAHPTRASGWSSSMAPRRRCYADSRGTSGGRPEAGRHLVRAFADWLGERSRMDLRLG